MVRSHRDGIGSGLAGMGRWPGALPPFMTQGHTVSTSPTDARLEVRIGGHLVADTSRALELHETGLPTRYYVPRADVRMDLFRATTFHTTCPFKGEASYWSTDVGGTTDDGIAWSYEMPKVEVAEIAGYLSFFADRAEVTVDGEALAA